MCVTKNELKKRFDFYNNKFFNNKLKVDVLEFSGRLTAAAGKAYRRNGELMIRLSTPYFKKYPEDLDNVLVHEMIHISGIFNHGPQFHAEVERINADGTVTLNQHCIARASVNWVYSCEKCDMTDERSRRLSKFNTTPYMCSGCGSRIVERKVDDMEYFLEKKKRQESSS